MEKKEPETFCPRSRQEWRQWLIENHSSNQSVWLVYYKKNLNISTIAYNDAVDEALCFGWIDSTKKSLNQETFMQFFCKRKPVSVWSKINKAKIERLTDQQLMTTAGFASVETARIMVPGQF